MKRLATAALLLSFALLPSACLHQQQQQQRREAEETRAKEPKVLPPQHLGAVHQVYPDQGFALLRIIGPMPTAGTTLITHPADGSNSRIGNLCISSLQASRDGIVAADIRSGTVAKGDRVFRYRNIASSAAEEDSGDVIATERPEGEADETDTPAPIPSPVPEEEEEAPIPPPSVETSILPTTAPSSAGSDPGAPSAPAYAPDYLDSIPDSIEGWDSL